MGICKHRSHPSTGCSVQESGLQKIRFIHVFQCSGILSNRSRKCFQSYRTTLKIQNQRLQNTAIRFIKAILVYLQKIQRKTGNLIGNHTIVFNLGKISYPFQKAVRKPWCSSGALGNFSRSIWFNFYSQNLCGSQNNGGKFLFVVKFQTLCYSKTITKGS